MLKKSSFFKNFGFRGLFFLIFSLPLFILLFSKPETVDVDPFLFKEAVVNTALLAFSVLFFSGFLGVGFSLLNLLYQYPLKRFLNMMMIMPLSFPPYVLAFIYLGLGSCFFSQGFFEFQGELWFLTLTLGFSLTPYVYLFCCLGLGGVDQSLMETEQVLKAGFRPFFKTAIAPQMGPYLLSALLLILFETLSDFGAASVVNVPVMTTIIYKMWFDLFSFSGAVGLCLKYSLIVFFFLFIEFLFKRNNQKPEGKHQTKIQGTRPKFFWRWLITIVCLIYVSLSFFLPFCQLALWSLAETGWMEVTESLKHSLFIGVLVAVLCVLVSVLLGFVFRMRGQKFGDYLPLTNIGYSLPGTLLAVSVYALLLFLFEEVGRGLLMTALIVSLCYKFFYGQLQTCGPVCGRSANGTG